MSTALIVMAVFFIGGAWPLSAHAQNANAAPAARQQTSSPLQMPHKAEFDQCADQFNQQQIPRTQMHSYLNGCVKDKLAAEAAAAATTSAQ